MGIGLGALILPIGFVTAARAAKYGAASTPPGVNQLGFMLSHVIHDWDEAACLKILGRVRDAIPANGRLLIVEQVIPDGNAFHPGKYLDMVMLVATGGRERTGSEYGDLLAKAGLALTRVVPTASAVSVVEAQKR